jgi:hypothetical protein
MIGDVIQLHGGKTTPNNLWEASIAAAKKANAIYGALIYVNDEGDTCYISIGSDRASFRGLIEEIRDDLRGV